MTHFTNSFKESLVIRETVKKQVKYKRISVETLNLSERFNFRPHLHNPLRSFTENLSSFKDVFQRKKKYKRSNQESLAFKDVFSYIYYTSRVPVVLKSVRDVFRRTVHYYRKPIEKPVITDHVTRQNVYSRHLTEAVPSRTPDIFSRKVNSSRLESEKIIFADQAARKVAYSRNIVEAIAYGVPTGLVAWWRFDEGIGTIAYDSSGNGNNCTLSGSPLPSWVAGKYGDALSFDGLQNYVDIPAAPSLFPSNAITISCWVYISSVNINTDSYMGFVARNVRVNGLQLIKEYGSANVIFETPGIGNVITTGTLIPDTWNFVVAVLISGVSATVYINGQVAGSSAGWILPTTSMDYWIGQAAVGTTNPYMNGYIDEVRIYNRALSQSEILQLYQDPTYLPSYTLDVFSRKVNYHRLQSETPVISDMFSYVYAAFSKLHQYTRALTENLSSLSESFKRTTVLKRAQIEKLLLQDVLSKIIHYSRKLSELPVLSEGFIRGRALYSRLQKETILIQDSFSRKIKFSRATVESFLIQDVFRRANKALRSFAESLPISDIFKRVSNYTRRLQETLSAIQSKIARKINFSRVTAEFLFIQDTFKRTGKSLRRFAESLSISDSFKRISNYTRHLQESLSIKDTFNYVYQHFRTHFSRVLTENIVVSEVIQRMVIARRRMAENLSAVSDYFVYIYSRFQNHYVRQFIEDLSSLSENLVRIVTIQDIINELNNLLINASAALTNLENQIKKKFARFRLGRNT